MKISRIKNRSVLFTQPVEDWNLNIHLIIGDQHNYVIDTSLGALSMEPVKE